MFSRHDRSDDHWERTRPLLPGQAGGHGGVGNDTRPFVNVIRHPAEAGVAWADLPECAGVPNGLWRRYNRWRERGVWERVAGEPRDGGTERPPVDGGRVRAHPGAAGAKKKRAGRAGGRPRRWAAAVAGSAPRSTRP